MARYLITGITGFAGPHLANLLIKNGNEVHGLVRGSNGMETDILDVMSVEDFSKLIFHYGNLRDKHTIDKLLKEVMFDGVFHLAAQSHPPTSFLDPIGTYQDNVIGSINLIESIIYYQPHCKLMFCSTSEVYGNTGSDGRLLKESDPVLPSNPYGNSKAAIDLYLQERMTNGKINAFITRAFSHTGPRRGRNFSISCDAYNLVRLGRFQRTDTPPILKVGNLETTRVVMDVRDTVLAYYLLMRRDESSGQVFNVCGDTPRKMGFYTDELIKIAGFEVKKEVDPKYYRPHDIHYQHGDSTKLHELTGWVQTYTIEETLNDLFTYWLRKV
jgi:GDP-mannose 4,6-dehydratase